MVNTMLEKAIIEATPAERSQVRDLIDALDPAPVYFTEAERCLIADRAEDLAAGRQVGRSWRESVTDLRNSLA